MDCNWCAVCSKHFHSDHQASLYCSDECRQTDALACCAFHECDHPDGSAHHDHLTFCHHHRPAIRIPSLPLLNLNPNPSAEQQAHGQHQADEWTRFLQQQYNTQYHSHSAHTSTLPSVALAHGHLGHGHRSSHSNSHSNSHSHSHGYGHHSHFGHGNAYRNPEIQEHSSRFTGQQSFLLSTSLPSISCQQQQQQTMKQLQERHNPIYHARQSQGSLAPSASIHSSEGSCPASLAHSLAKLSLCKHSGLETSAHADMEDCEQPCIVRKNKALPPPTLSHILPAKISNPASLSPTSATNPAFEGDKHASWQTSSSGLSDEEDDQDGSLSHAWPKMDNFFFPDHCCRTSACATTRGTSRSTTNGGSNKNGKNKANKNNKQAFVSELPPPPMYAHAQRDSNGCIALSASIWGAGWRQVEPLPESFVKTIQKSNLLWAGCEREHHPHTRHHQRNRRDSGYSQGCTHTRSNNTAGYNNNGNGGNGRNRAFKTHQKSASDASWATDCSCRLPRSLQFID